MSTQNCSPTNPKNPSNPVQKLVDPTLVMVGGGSSSPKPDTDRSDDGFDYKNRDLNRSDDMYTEKLVFSTDGVFHQSFCPISRDSALSL